jgi:cell fate regulator YaaT (PSP1 superfamily)
MVSTMQNNRSDQDDHREQEPARIVGVRFQPAGKPYHFSAEPDQGLTTDDWVVVETVYGEQVGQVTHVPNEPPEHIPESRLRSVVRRATGLDMARYQLMQKRADALVEAAREEAKAVDKQLRIISAEYTLDGNSAIVLCTGKVDKKHFSTLRRKLSSKMDCRVELRSVGPRDQAKTLSGYGVCGEERCCVRFLTDFDPVSIRMAKDQAISMAPSDITGMCGRLRCCLAYEHQVYKEEAKSLPRVKARVETDKGLGRVIDLDILKGEIIVEIPPYGPRRDRQRYRYAADDVKVVPRKKNDRKKKKG